MSRITGIRLPYITLAVSKAMMILSLNSMKARKDRRFHEHCNEMFWLSEFEFKIEVKFEVNLKTLEMIVRSVKQ